MITDCFDRETEPIIKVSDFCGEKKHLVDVCLIIFSWEIQEHLLNTFECEKIGELGACNGRKPIYKIHYKGKDVAFYLTGIGSAVAAMQCYEASWLIGATKFIMFGSCGSLDREQTYGKYIVPTESYRGEGFSYYYAEPADYIEIKNAHKLSAIFEEMGVPHVLGRNWTTDALYRETKGLVAKRKEEGCLSVEMELAGVQALCDFHGLELYDFLEAGDVLEASGYEVEGLHNANHDFGKLYIGLEVALRV
ncbi:MAG: nucleoside phosphorylase [Lachnospiraceae bacterium]|nr:nucleoside phosphorylase [Lachnospiraceae bacterium]